MKKTIALLLTLALAAGILGGCAGTVVVVAPPTEDTTPTASRPVQTDGTPVKTGLSLVATVSGESAGETDGKATTEISLIAVTVDDNGVITSCVIDSLQADVGFNDQGVLTQEGKTFQTKNELGEAYGMKQFSPIGKEWNEQVAAVAEYAVGRTADELRSGAVDPAGKATDADLAASATIYLGGFIAGIAEAADNASHLGAQVGDTLVIAAISTMGSSVSATVDAKGVAQTTTGVAVVTLNGDTITSCILDGVQTDVKFDASGTITSDLTAPVLSKNQLGEAYGMKQFSSIGKEWNEQAAAFSAYVTGKTAAEVAGIAVNEGGGASDVDLAATVSISIGDFQALIAKAAR